MVRRLRGVRLALLCVAVGLVLVLVAGVITAAVGLRRPYPDQDGAVTVAGLSGTVQVQRDSHGVAQIYADTTADLFRAQGFVHAQDRFFEMDWRRHLTAGRLSELTGPDPDALAADTVVRTLGWRRVAAAELAQADPQTRANLEAYAAGVNQYLQERSPGELAIDYPLLGLAHDLPAIEPWTPLDSLSWFTAMAWDLRGNYDDELARARIYAGVKDVDRVAQLYPDYPYARHQPILATSSARGVAVRSALGPGAGRSVGPARTPAPGADLGPALLGDDAQRALDDALRAVASVPQTMGGQEGVGSNSWVLSGDLTSTGKPLLANDPHLAPSLPGIWYQVGLHCRVLSAACPYDVSGFTFSGVPGVIVGHTDRFAWGITNLGPDVTDFYLEKVTGDTYELDGRSLPLATRQETIAVAGADPVTITIRSTGHGPVLSDAVSGLAQQASGASAAGRSPYAVALAWTALQPGRDLDAIFAVNQARDFASFRAAAVLLDAPAQNFVYADVDGHIGYQASGRIPLRAQADAGTEVGAGTKASGAATSGIPVDGSWPLPGWDSRYTWRGYVDVTALPWVKDPAEGFIVAANQAVTGPDGPVRFGTDVDYGYRSQRIRDIVTQSVGAGRRLGVADMETIQADTRSAIAGALLPLIRSAKVDAFTASGVAVLQNWDLSEPENSAAAAFFNVFWERLLELTFADEVPAGSRPDGGSRWYEAVRLLLADPVDPWWDDRRTANIVETRDAVVREAVVQARLRLTQLLGKDPSRWTWGSLHRLTLTRAPLGRSEATTVIHRLLNRGPVGMPGGPAIVNALGWDAASGSFGVTWGPSMRMVVDLSDLDGSRWVNQTGQSGHPGHPNYTDQFGAWVRNDTYSWPFSREAVQATVEHTLVLRPAAR